MKTTKDRGCKAARLRKRGQGLADRGSGLAALRSFLKAAKLGDEEAQVTVGYDYAYGITGSVDVDEALRWWKRAYKQGSAGAAFDLGMFYRDANQWSEAVKWFEKALKAGEDDGLIELARIHLRYDGDRAAGLRYLELAKEAKAKLTPPARRARDGNRRQRAGSVVPRNSPVHGSRLI